MVHQNGRMAAPPLTREPAAGRAAGPARLRSPIARAVVPVLGGVIVLGLIFLATWLIAVLVSGGDDATERLAPTEIRVGRVEQVAEEIEESGPIVFPDLDTTSGTRTLVLDHEGTDPTRGWIVYWGFRAGGDPLCHVTQVERTSTFVDCTGARFEVTELAPPEGVRPRVDDRTTLMIDLQADTTG